MLLDRQLTEQRIKKLVVLEMTNETRQLRLEYQRVQLSFV